MVTTRKSSKAAAGKDNVETPRTPVGNVNPSHAEDEASSHRTRRDEAPVPPAPPQPSLRGEPSGSLARRPRPSRAAALQMIRELLAHPPMPEGHAAWLARIWELADIAGDLPSPSQATNVNPPKSTRAAEAPGAPAAPAHSHGATSPVQADPRATQRDRPNATTQLPTTKAPEKSNNSCQILRTQPDARVHIERGHERERRTIRDLARAGRANRPLFATASSKVLVGGCLAFSKEPRSVTFPPKFNPSLPSRYDGTTPLLDFLQIGRAHV